MSAVEEGPDMHIPGFGVIGSVLHLDWHVVVAIAIGAVFVGGFHHLYVMEKARHRETTRRAEVELYAAQAQSRPRRGGFRRVIFGLMGLGMGVSIIAFALSKLHVPAHGTTAAPQPTPTAAPAPKPAPTHTVTIPAPVTRVVHQVQAAHFPAALWLGVCVLVFVVALVIVRARRGAAA